MTAIFGVFVALSMIVLVVGHGHIRDPPSRNAAWTYGFDTPKQFTYNELNCGGFSRQWDKNGGKCGVCGDPYDKTHPQYVHPGKFATKTITKTYREGQEIEVKIKVTTNHMGSFTFSVGEIGTAPITQEKLKYVLKQPNGATKWKINVAKKDAEFKIKLVLPRGLTCDHCVMQWWWKVGNSWGCDGPNDCGMGKGRQETFVNCADIRITKSDGSVPPTPPTRPPPPTQQPPRPTTQKPTKPPPTNGPNPGGCKAIGAWKGSATMDVWCRDNCAAGHCPANMCKCK